MRDKPDGFDCFADCGIGGMEGVSVSDDLLDVLASGAEYARTGFEGRSFRNGGGTPLNDSLSNARHKANKQLRLLAYTTEPTKIF